MASATAGRRLFLVFLTVAVTTALSGCTESGDDTTLPTTPSTTTSTTVPPTPRPTEAPQVAAPLDLSPHRRHSCALLSTSQESQLGFPTDDVSEGATLEEGICQWSTTEGRTDLYTLHIYLTEDPLGDAYQRSNDRLDSGKRVWEPFEIRTIGGLPAVVKVMGDPSTYCEVVVGTGAGQGIRMVASISHDDPDPELCDRVVTAGEWVIEAARG